MNVKAETYKHIGKVRIYIDQIIRKLLLAAENHDTSKLEEPEAKSFEKLTPKLRSSTYDSSEYKRYLRQISPALKHHYRANRHHPQHFKDGIKGMTLIDLIEMLCDWKAATLRHKNGDIFKSIELNQKRFGYSDELKQILINTVKRIDREQKDN